MATLLGISRRQLLNYLNHGVPREIISRAKNLMKKRPLGPLEKLESLRNVIDLPMIALARNEQTQMNQWKEPTLEGNPILLGVKIEYFARLLSTPDDQVHLRHWKIISINSHLIPESIMIRAEQTLQG